MFLANDSFANGHVSTRARSRAQFPPRFVKDRHNRITSGSAGQNAILCALYPALRNERDTLVNPFQLESLRQSSSRNGGIPLVQLPSNNKAPLREFRESGRTRRL